MGRVRAGDLKLLLGTDDASEGLNLQRLGTLINIDLPWNPTRLEQRKGRIQRIGQARTRCSLDDPRRARVGAHGVVGGVRNVQGGSIMQGMEDSNMSGRPAPYCAGSIPTPGSLESTIAKYRAESDPHLLKLHDRAHLAFDELADYMASKCKAAGVELPGGWGKAPDNLSR